MCRQRKVDSFPGPLVAGDATFSGMVTLRFEIADSRSVTVVFNVLSCCLIAGPLTVSVVAADDPLKPKGSLSLMVIVCVGLRPFKVALTGAPNRRAIFSVGSLMIRPKPLIVRVTDITPGAKTMSGNTAV